LSAKHSVIENYGFVGSSPAMSSLYEKIANVSTSHAPVFIQGETGTGKELCAEAIHFSGSRAKGPFVPVNCGAIPRELMESEMFGHLKGSFTGAIANRDGAAKMADGGTLFLDEVCELPLDLQSKLLRFLQTGFIQPVGAGKPQKVDVRIVCATNKDPKIEVSEGRFRQDLFYRLFVLPLKLPPLRARGADIGLIANHFLEECNSQEGKSFSGFCDDALALLEGHDWPGNVREMQNAVRLAVVMNKGPLIKRSMLVELMNEDDHGLQMDVSAFNGGEQSEQITQLWQIERDAIEAAIANSNGSVPKAAQKLGVSPSTIYRKREGWNGHRPLVN